jgi:hypothetical protein
VVLNTSRSFRPGPYVTRETSEKQRGNGRLCSLGGRVGHVFLLQPIHVLQSLSQLVEPTIITAHSDEIGQV